MKRLLSSAEEKPEAEIWKQKEEEKS